MSKDAIRICLIGGSGSGKTALFSGIYQSLVGGVVNVGSGANASKITLKVTSIEMNQNFFTTDSENDDEAIKAAVMAASEMDTNYLIRNYFMDSTSDSTEFAFELRVDNKRCCDMVITDYAGEILDRPNEAIAEYFDGVCKNIAESDAIIIIADAAAIAETPNNPTAINNKIYSMRVNAMYDAITDVVIDNHRSLTTLIALTKTDHPSIPEGFKRANFSEISRILVERSYERTHMATLSSGGSFGVIPVSAIGEGNTNEKNHIKPDADIKQKNIDVAIIFCIYNSVARIVNEKENQIQALEAEFKRIKFDLGKKAKAARAENRAKLAELQEEKRLLSKILGAFAGDTSYFSRQINEMHLSTDSQIGRAEG